MTQAVLTDVEGTTTSLAFVKDVLFPYARDHIGQFVREHASDADVAALLAEARGVAGSELDVDDLIDLLIKWIDEDRKVTPLKSLQGLVWEEGYRRGAFTGHIYEDAARRLREWHAAGLRLYVFSSGSVRAQQLLFSHTDYGDFTSLFSGYFDTHIGPKRDVASYRNISEAIDTPPADVVFLSDIEEELNAAAAAGLQTYHLVRDGPLPPRGIHPQVRDFDAITF